MKRSFMETDFGCLAMANCLLLLSGRSDSLPCSSDINSQSRVFECKTCNRRFSSFQALGGHRASHKKPRLIGDDAASEKTKPKTHECSICGADFAIGQALGGHMRRHRAAAIENRNLVKSPVVKKSNSGSRRVLWLDLNLTPTENDLELGMGKGGAPMVDCFF